jgi:hypothetical protein
MRKLTWALYSVNWRLVLALTSIAVFAMAGSADDTGPS